MIGELVTNLLRDARFGFRLLRTKPGFTAVAVLTVAVLTLAVDPMVALRQE